MKSAEGEEALGLKTIEDVSLTGDTIRRDYN